MAERFYWEHCHRVAQLLKIRRHWAITNDVILPTIEASGGSFVKTIDRSMASSTTDLATAVCVSKCRLIVHAIVLEWSSLVLIARWFLVHC